MYNYLLGWKLEFQIENQQSCSKVSAGGGSSSVGAASPPTVPGAMWLLRKGWEGAAAAAWFS